MGKTIKQLRPKTAVFYGILTLLVMVVIMIVIATNSKPRFISTENTVLMGLDVILDAGHGGMDGGAVSADGICEAPITLAITQKTQALLRFFGISAGLTRGDEGSLGYDPSASARKNKNADLQARLAIARQYQGCDFLSIHLNQFTIAKYHGAQVFYSGNHPASQALATQLQNQLRTALDPANGRSVKPAPDGVFLMKNISAPAVTIECGFLSNPEECLLLQQEAYQTKIAIAITNGYLIYNRG